MRGDFHRHRRGDRPHRLKRGTLCLLSRRPYGRRAFQGWNLSGVGAGIDQWSECWFFPTERVWESLTQAVLDASFLPCDLPLTKIDG